MSGLEMLDVVIGLVFVYLLLSLVCSAVSELIETVLKYRASDLERSMRELFNDEDGTGLTKQFYEHPLIYGLFRGEYNPKKTRNLPSYISARDFALTLMDIVLPATGTTKSGTAYATATANTNNIAIPPATGTSKPLSSLQIAIGALQNQQIKKALAPLVDAAGDDVSKARENIENWYNSTMERLTGWYRRRIRWALLVLAFLVTIVMNVDTLTIAKYLSLNAAARNAIVEQAIKQSAPSQETAKQTAVRDSNDTEKLVKVLSSVQELGLPIGWSTTPFKWTPVKFSNYWEQSSPHLAGWIITAIALSMGASFWFDFLKKLVDIRSTIKPEEKSSKEEATKKE
jgi:hypothetical protein